MKIIHCWHHIKSIRTPKHIINLFSFALQHLLYFQGECACLLYLVFVDADVQICFMIISRSWWQVVQASSSPWYKTFFYSLLGQRVNKLECLSLACSLRLESSLERSTWKVLHLNRLLYFPANTILGWKGLPRTNALAYYDSSSMLKWSFMRLAGVENVIQILFLCHWCSVKISRSILSWQALSVWPNIWGRPAYRGAREMYFTWVGSWTYLQISKLAKKDYQWQMHYLITTFH